MTAHNVYKGDLIASLMEQVRLVQLKPCPFCESYARLTKCKAPGCTAEGCELCLLEHNCEHLTDDPARGI